MQPSELFSHFSSRFAGYGKSRRQAKTAFERYLSELGAGNFEKAAKQLGILNAFLDDLVYLVTNPVTFSESGGG